VLQLPGSGSDFAVFLHHLSVPVLDLGFRGNRGGQYHTAFDDFPVVDRYLDPGFEAHELAGRVAAELLAELADAPGAGFDQAEATRAMAALVRAAGTETDEGGEAWLGTERAETLARALDDLAGEAPAAADAGFYRALAAPDGLEQRAWYVNRLWAPGLETGYSAETLPALRRAAARGERELEAELRSMVIAVQELASGASPAYIR
jgi:N-acetylated-alpha-linked acidic dipeptidase